ncbi:MAG: hypothetical protein Q9228_007920, partial [Teloschistes exilis]
MASERPQAGTTAWPSTSANSFRQQYMTHSIATDSDILDSTGAMGRREFLATSTQMAGTSYVSGERTLVPSGTASSGSSADHPLDENVSVSRPVSPNDSTPSENLSTNGIATTTMQPAEEPIEKDDAYEEGTFQLIKTAATKDTTNKRPNLPNKGSGRMTEEDLFRVLSRRKTNTSDAHGSQLTPVVTQEEQAEIERLMSRMFGQNRREHSEEEKTRHVGLIFKNLTVNGMGLGAALQPTLSDPFLGLPRLLSKIFSKGKSATGKPP